MMQAATRAELRLRQVQHERRFYQLKMRQAQENVQQNRPVAACLDYVTAYHFSETLEQKSQIQQAIQAILSQSTEAAEKLLIACLLLAAKMDLDTKNKIAGYLSLLVEESREELSFWPFVALDVDLKAPLLGRVGELKPFLYQLIQLLEGPQKCRALWLALIPTTPLQRIFEIPQHETTAYHRGTFKKIIDELTGLQRGQAIDPYVIQVIELLAQEDRQAFLRNVHQHGRELFAQLPGDLTRAVTAPVASAAAMASSQGSVVVTPSAPLLPMVPTQGQSMDGNELL